MIDGLLWLDEAEKWEKITYAGIFTCTVLATYNLSKPHRHYEEPPVCFLLAHPTFCNLYCPLRIYVFSPNAVMSNQTMGILFSFLLLLPMLVVLCHCLSS